MSAGARFGGGIDYSETTENVVADFTGVLAGALLLVAAFFDVLQGLSAIANDEVYAAGGEYLYEFDMTAWGWIHLVVGLLAGAVAVGILAGASWAQVCGLIIAGLVMLTNFAFIPYYPFWAITVIAFSVLVMWALCTQLGRSRPTG